MSEKPIEIVYSKKLNTKNIKEGMLLLDSTNNPKMWHVDDELIKQIEKFEKVNKLSNKLAIRGNKLTGKFLEFKYYEDNPEK